MEGNTVLKVQDLHKKFRGFQINNVSFSLEAGYIMGFIGRNGSGKTTVIKLIQNVLIKDSGTVTVCGYDNRRQEVRAKNEIGFVADVSPFVKRYSLLENALLFGKYYSEFDLALFKSYLKRFRLEEQQILMDLSKGMQARYQLAFALSHKPRLLIMDEPNDGLDPVFRREFLSLLQELICDNRMGILFSTHITDDLDKVADYITYIDRGQLILTQDKETLLDRFCIVKGKRDLLEILPKDEFIAVRCYKEGFEGLTEYKKDMMALLSKSPDQFLIQRPTLEDIIYYYSKRSREDG